VNLKLYIAWVAVGWKLGAGRLEWCPGCRLKHKHSIMTLLKPLSSPSMPIPYEKYNIQTFHQEGKLIPEQYLLAYSLHGAESFLNS
jgi:hypothetical protein